MSVMPTSDTRSRSVRTLRQAEVPGYPSLSTTSPSLIPLFHRFPFSGRFGKYFTNRRSRFRGSITGERKLCRPRTCVPGFWIFQTSSGHFLKSPRITASRSSITGEKPLCLPRTCVPGFWIFPTSSRRLFEKPQAPSIPITSKPVDVPEIWQDYQPQSGSWLNSAARSLVAIAIIILPFFVEHITQPVKASTKYEIRLIYRPIWRN